MRVHVDHIHTGLITEVLNRLTALDPDAMRELLECHAPANERLREARNVILGAWSEGGDPALGLLGIFQALYSVAGKQLVAHYDEAGRLTRFSERDWPDDRPPFMTAADVLQLP